MAKVNLKHSGAVIGQQIDRVIDGSVVVDNTLSALDLESKKPVDSQGIAEAIDNAVEGVILPFGKPMIIGGVDSSGTINTQSNRLRTERVPVSDYIGKLTIYIDVPNTIIPLVFTSGYAAWGYDGETPIKVLPNIAYSNNALTFDCDGTFDNVIIAFKREDNADISRDELAKSSYATSLSVIDNKQTNELSTLRNRVDGEVVESAELNIEYEYYEHNIHSTAGTLNYNPGYAISTPIALKAGETLKYRIYAGAAVVLAKRINEANYSVLRKVPLGAKYYTFYYTAHRDESVCISGAYKRPDMPIRAWVYNSATMPITTSEPDRWSEMPTSGKYIKGMADALAKVTGGNASSMYEYANGFIYATGAVNTTSTSYRITKPIAVKKGDVVRWRAACWGDTSALAYSADESASTWINKVTGRTNDYSIRYVWVADADGFVRLSFNPNFPFDLMIEKRDPLNILSGYSSINYSQGRRYSAMRDFGTQPAADGSSGSFMNIADDYNTLINNIYEPLRTANPSYISRVSAGKDATGTYEQWVYTFEPPYWQQSILLVGGIHANEEDAIAGLARIMQMITNEYEGDEDLTYIRQNVKITVVPVVNVWGYSQTPKVRTTSNGGNLQSWDADTVAEVANLKPIFENLAPELSFVADMHTTTNDSYKDFYVVLIKHGRNARTIFKTNAWLTQNYAIEAGVKEQLIGYRDTTTTLSAYCYNVLGVQVATLELSDFHWDTAKATSKVQTMGVTMWLNYIIQQINDNYNPAQFVDEADYKIVKG